MAHSSFVLYTNILLYTKRHSTIVSMADKASLAMMQVDSVYSIIFMIRRGMRGSAVPVAIFYGDKEYLDA